MSGAPRSETRTEYALVKSVGFGRFVKIAGLTPDGRWNETYDAQYAIDQWYPGTVVASRTVTVFEPVVSEWSRVPSTSEGEGT